MTTHARWPSNVRSLSTSHAWLPRSVDLCGNRTRRLRIVLPIRLFRGCFPDLSSRLIRAVSMYGIKSEHLPTDLSGNNSSETTSTSIDAVDFSTVARAMDGLQPPHPHVISQSPTAIPSPGPTHRLSPVAPSIASTTTPMMAPTAKPVYSSPPPAHSSAENNTCRLIEYRGVKVAAFIVDGRELICLPQAFELFLKHLVGGLHTVYTKLKRLDVVPIVCNVEQVRILRGLGAIQPGVNRCKLIAPNEFDTLYADCTNSR